MHPGLFDIIDAAQPAWVGRVIRILPGHVEASGPACSVGDLCCIEPKDETVAAQGRSLLAEVAGVEADHIILVPLETSLQVWPDARVVAVQARGLTGVGNGYGGRIIDALGQPLDERAPVSPEDRVSLAGRVLTPMQRAEPKKILQTGIRSIDGLLTLGLGQRIGIFAASGVGKTTLVRQLVNQVDCDRCVLCLVGERGKEVESIWRALERSDTPEKYTCVAATSDLTAALRVRAVYQALCLAEYWRDCGERVLLLLDSVTRFAMALRDIGLAAGEPPTLRAYTPNVFAALPRIVERCGAAKAGGSITAVMTVLSETDDVDDPIVEVMKSLLDGHIILSRSLAEQGHFPAIDVTRSVSRQSEHLMPEAQLVSARTILSLLSTYDEARIMIESGIYKKGANPKIDRAVGLRDSILAFLKQKQVEQSPIEVTQAALEALVSGGRP